MTMRWMALLVANAVVLGVLGLYRASEAQPNRNPLPFANDVEQRFEIIAQLQKINQQLAEQNALLRSGKLRVVVELPNPAGPHDLPRP